MDSLKTHHSVLGGQKLPMQPAPLHNSEQNVALSSKDAPSYTLL
jgi:hypothetical protein